MMNKYYAKVLKLDPDIEEEVTLDVNGIEITCFASVCPFKISVGKEYPVAFEFDDFDISEQSTEETSLARLGSDYSYELKGKLDGDTVDVGIRIRDEFLSSEYGYLDGKFVSLKVGRLDVEFLEEE